MEPRHDVDPQWADLRLDPVNLGSIDPTERMAALNNANFAIE
jgi:hypothetical protein